MNRYNMLYEQFDQDTQHAVETVIELENKVKSLKGTIKDYKFEIASYRLLLNNNN